MGEYVTVKFTRREAKALQKVGAGILTDDDLAEKAYLEYGEGSIAVGAVGKITAALVGEKTGKGKKK